MAREIGVVAVFSYLDTLNDAIRAVRDGGEKFEVYSPVPNHHIEHAIGKGPSAVRWFTLAGTSSGVAFAIFLTWWVNHAWPLIVDGKPYQSIPAFTVIYFECFILLGVLFTLFGLFVNARLPSFSLPASYDPRFSEDKFGLFVECPLDRIEKVNAILQELGAEETRNVH